MKKLSLAYFGSPSFSAEFLEKILNDKDLPVEIKLVVTQPDKPVGRKQIMTPSAVKIIAEKYNLTVLCLPSSDLRSLSSDLSGIDFALVFAYGFKTLIGKEILASTKLKFGSTNSGFINIHPSLLPKYRGASPIAYPLIMGDSETGVSLFVMDEKMDHGPIIVQKSIPLSPTILRPELEVQLTELAYQMFKKILSKKIELIPLVEQDHSKKTHARYLTKQDGFIPLKVLQKAINNEPLSSEDLPPIIKEYLDKSKTQMANDKSISKFKCQNSSQTIYSLFRGLIEWPGLWTFVNINDKQMRLKITSLTIEQLNNGTIDKQQKPSRLIIGRVQLEGKKPVDFKTFNTAYQIL